MRCLILTVASNAIFRPAQRKYGYFVLPLLRRGALKARLDARMLRREGCLEIKQLWLEEGG